MKNSITVKTQNHGYKVYSTIESAWNNKQRCDCTILTNGEGFISMNLNGGQLEELIELGFRHLPTPGNNTPTTNQPTEAPRFNPQTFIYVYGVGRVGVRYITRVLDRNVWSQVYQSEKGAIYREFLGCVSELTEERLRAILRDTLNTLGLFVTTRKASGGWNRVSKETERSLVNGKLSQLITA